MSHRRQNRGEGGGGARGCLPPPFSAKVDLTIRHIASERDKALPPPPLFLAANIIVPKFT